MSHLGEKQAPPHPAFERQRTEDDIPTERIYPEPITKTVRKVPEVELLRALDDVDATELDACITYRYRPSTSVREFLRRALEIKKGK